MLSNDRFENYRRREKKCISFHLSGFAGQSPFEVAWVDALADQYKDYYQEIKPFLMVAFGFAQGDKEKLAKEVAEPAIKKFFSILEKSAWVSSESVL